MKTVPRSRWPIIQKAHPNATMGFRDGVEVIAIPTYDPDTDVAGERLLQIIEDRDGPLRPGDILADRFGNTFKIVDPASLIPVRKGPGADFGD
jgi:hypothetical protein